MKCLEPIHCSLPNTDAPLLWLWCVLGLTVLGKPLCSALSLCRALFWLLWLQTLRLPPMPASGQGAGARSGSCGRRRCPSPHHHRHKRARPRCQAG